MWNERTQRLTDADRKERVKEQKETGRKEKEDPKEREDQMEHCQIQVTRGIILGMIQVGTARRLVLRLIRGRLLNLFPLCSQFELKLREFS